MRAHLYDEMEEKVGKWFIFYSFWEKTLESFPNSIQSQYAAVYEAEFENILDVQVPKTSAVSKYTQAAVSCCVRSPSYSLRYSHSFGKNFRISGACAPAIPAHKIPASNNSAVRFIAPPCVYRILCCLFQQEYVPAGA